VEEGSRYARYVEDHCRRLAAALRAESYVVGYQNHDNRPTVEWTRPEIGEVIAGLEAQRVVVVPVSFMQEQSETLAELDFGLAAVAASAGLEFHRVPIPHDDPRFIALLADLVGPFLAGAEADTAGWRPCRCRPRDGAVCLNRGLERAR
jgi:protoporphyrin/coproporphyrin ferrochelatase